MNKDEQNSGVYEFGPFVVDARERVLLRDGKPVTLPPKLFDTLLALVEQSGHIIDKNALMQTVWPDTFVEDSNLSSNVSQLRKVLGEGSDGALYIETIPRRGYRFTAEVAELVDDADLIVRRRTRARIITHEADASDAATAPSRRLLDVAPVEALDVSQPRGISPTYFARTATYRTKLIFSSVFVLLLAGVILFFWVSRRRNPATIADVRTIAILPFKEIGGNGSDEKYLGLGMADALITRFGNVRQIVVRPTSSVRRYVESALDSIAAGRELGVDAVLEGNIQRAGERVRVTVTLLRVTDATPLWAQAFDDRFTDILSVQDSISEKVLAALRLTLRGEEQERFRKHYTENSEAYQFYVKGRFYWNKRSEENLKKAIDQFKEAVNKDPNYALAYAGLADSYALMEFYAGSRAAESLPLARAAAERALQIDDSLAEAHASLGLINQYSWRWAEAEKEFQRAIGLNPNYATAHQWYATYLKKVRRFDDALNEIRKAQSIDPLSPIIIDNLADTYILKNDFESAIREGKKAIELDPTFSVAYDDLGLAYLRAGNQRDAIAALEKAVETSSRSSVSLGRLGQAYAIVGRQNEARVILKELEGRYAQQQSTGTYIAMVCVGLGENDQAFSWLEKDFQSRSAVLPFIAHWGWFDSLRGDARYVDLLRRMGLT